MTDTTILPTPPTSGAIVQSSGTKETSAILNAINHANASLNLDMNSRNTASIIAADQTNSLTAITETHAGTVANIRETSLTGMNLHNNIAENRAAIERTNGEARLASALTTAELRGDIKDVLREVLKETSAISRDVVKEAGHTREEILKESARNQLETVKEASRTREYLFGEIVRQGQITDTKIERLSDRTDDRFLNASQRNDDKFSKLQDSVGEICCCVKDAFEKAENARLRDELVVLRSREHRV